MQEESALKGREGDSNEGTRRSARGDKPAAP